MTYLTTHFPFSPSSSSSSPSSSSSSNTESLPPNGSQVIISDTLQSPGHFALYHFISAALSSKLPVKERRNVIWVDFRAEGKESLTNIMKKLGTPIPNSTTAFIHITPNSLPLSLSLTNTSSSPGLFTNDGPSLKSTYDSIISHLPTLTAAATGKEIQDDKSTKGPLIILDGLAELLCLGFRAEDVGRFVRAIFTKVKQTNSILISTIHTDSLPLSSDSTSASTSTGNIDSPEIDLLLRLTRLSQGVWFRISHLPSGRSGDVMGEISSHPVSIDNTNVYPSVPRSNPLQYRLESSTVKIFPKGTGRGFL